MLDRSDKTRRHRENCAGLAMRHQMADFRPDLLTMRWGMPPRGIGGSPDTKVHITASPHRRRVEAEIKTNGLMGPRPPPQRRPESSDRKARRHH
jgi:hypothetical protein